MEGTAARALTLPVLADRFAECYALLQETFHAAELNSASEMLANLTANGDCGQPDRSFMLARFSQEPDPGTLIALISGFYLPLNDPEHAGHGIGFIEYLVTRPEFRRQGHASHLLRSLECALQECALSRGERLTLVLGEVEPWMVPFKVKRGYRWPRGSRYCQPPITYDLRTGRPLSPPLPKLLMVKWWNDPLEAGLLLSALEVIFRSRYVPKNASPPVVRQILAGIMENIYTPFARSLCLDGKRVIMNEDFSAV
jgi:GNAT superfamily N-acetyltransferase